MRRTHLQFQRLLGACASLVLALAACSDDGTSESLGGSETSTDSDVDGDGDGDPSTDTEAGDGDGDPTTDTEAGDGDGTTDPGDGDGDQPCVYPDAAEPMALDQPLAAYAWPEALRNNFVSTPLSLEDAYCDSDEEIDWSPHDLLVFISIPAW